jgi:hypothetical protein
MGVFTSDPEEKTQAKNVWVAKTTSSQHLTTIHHYTNNQDPRQHNTTVILPKHFLEEITKTDAKITMKGKTNQPYQYMNVYAASMIYTTHCLWHGIEFLQVSNGTLVGCSNEPSE